MSREIPFDYERDIIQSSNVQRMEYDAHIGREALRAQLDYEREKRHVFRMIAAHRVSVAKWTVIAWRFKVVLCFFLGVTLAQAIVLIVSRFVGPLPIPSWVFALVATFWVIPYSGFIIASAIRHRRVVERNNEELRLKSRLLFLRSPRP